MHPGAGGRQARARREAGGADEPRGAPRRRRRAGDGQNLHAGDVFAVLACVAVAARPDR